MAPKRKYSQATTARRAKAARLQAPYLARRSYKKSSFSERKFFDTALSFTFDATGEVPATGQLNLVPQGATESTRVGRKIQIESVQIRAKLNYDPAATNASALSYVYLVQDKQANKSAAAVTDILTSTDLGVAMINMANSGRFIIHKRWVQDWNLKAGVDGAYAPLRDTLDFYKKCSIPVEFSSTTGAIGEITSNNLFLIASSSGADDLVTLTGTCRIRYQD